MEAFRQGHVATSFEASDGFTSGARVHPISPSPKVFLILDELSLSSIRSQLTSQTATARVPDQTCSVPARASARVRSSSFQLAFQLVPARVPSRSRFSWWSGSTIFKT
ncbi:hypothetical protein F2Q68_00032093 [Brassica cretica]|uniref:Uncharacterized protein n=2 Tax=Brassica cretica TaxID=69181 RepID=A0A3N6TF95_BRACR|nr:hypothetical protein F2Q68_00032093 [Brassica cretica]KAF3532980.1 hypothetical protein DY000_02036853 [Brassica cretica]